MAGRPSKKDKKMAAPEGNKFWQLRSKHGRDKLFSSPELLWEAACEYFEWCDQNPWTKKDWVGKDGMEVTRDTQRPYTLTGLCLYLGCNEAYFRQFKDTGPQDFSTVITRIEDTIRTLKFEGATVGVFNANIISRDLGLIDNKEHKLTGDKDNPIQTRAVIEIIPCAVPIAGSEKDVDV